MSDFANKKAAASADTRQSHYWNAPSSGEEYLPAFGRKVRRFPSAPSLYDLDLDLANSCLLITMALLVIVLPVLLFVTQSF